MLAIACSVPIVKQILIYIALAGNRLCSVSLPHHPTLPPWGATSSGRRLGVLSTSWGFHQVMLPIEGAGLGCYLLRGKPGVLTIEGAGLGCFTFSVHAWDATYSGCRHGVLPLQAVGLGCYIFRVQVWVLPLQGAGLGTRSVTSAGCRPGVLTLQCAGLGCYLFSMQTWGATFTGRRPGVLPTSWGARL